MLATFDLAKRKNTVFSYFSETKFDSIQTKFYNNTISDCILNLSQVKLCLFPFADG